MHTYIWQNRVQSEWRFFEKEPANLPKLFHVEHIHSAGFSYLFTI